MLLRCTAWLLSRLRPFVLRPSLAINLGLRAVSRHITSSPVSSQGNAALHLPEIDNCPSGGLSRSNMPKLEQGGQVGVGVAGGIEGVKVGGRGPAGN